MDSCPDCGAVRLPYLGSPHKCHAKFMRKSYDAFKSSEKLEPHTVDEYELGYLATGRTSFDFPES